MYKVKLDQFEGPLDLLLELTSKEKLDISRVSLAKIADQYLEYIEDRGNVSLQNLADFLDVASKLILIKSKSLLPLLVLTEEEEEEIEDLEARLAEYKKFKDASAKIAKLLESKRESFSREGFLQFHSFFCPPESICVDDLKCAYEGLIKETPVTEELEKESMEEIVTLEEKINHLHDFIEKRIESSFSQLVAGSKDKVEVVVSFLAMLEMVKQRIIQVEQNELFEDIKLKKSDSHSDTKKK
ncbi:MAG: segregation/condensation protein A [Candidatus Moranbacteria bacterium]|nr:segregation/condensation protein A [Candidatus Moranbacteria bacterium]